MSKQDQAAHLLGHDGWPQVGERIQLRSDLEQTLLRPHFVGVGVPLVAAERLGGIVYVCVRESVREGGRE